MKFRYISVAFLLAAFAVSCSSTGQGGYATGNSKQAELAAQAEKRHQAERQKEEDEQFTPFRKRHSAKAYYQFIQTYPANRWVETARLNAEEMELAPFAAKGTVEAYSEFIDKFPRNRFAAVAKAAVEELVFEQVKQANTVIGYAEFMRNYPASPLAPEAAHRRDALEYAPYKAKDTVDALVEFINNFPLSGFQDAALIRIGELDNGKIKSEVERVCAERRHNVSRYDCAFVSYAKGALAVKVLKPAEAEQGQQYLMGGPGYAEELERRFQEWKHDLFGRFREIPGVFTVKEE